ncbi:hypothetical protein [Virgibacillus ihumii]|uniref:hypothetical protein n=1 Tax=Virgibacillus ihumii TaxID=2686091 RepID=UPI00157CEF85|nr:hypothetical protein [Virgibacillus ihumii]
MRNLLVTTAAGVLIFTAGGFAGTGVFQPNGEEAHAETGAGQMDQQRLETNAAGSFPEFSVLDEQIDADDYEMQVVEDNEHTRIIILSDEDGNGQFKSVYVKDSNVLKIIDFDQGMVFRGTIG